MVRKHQKMDEIKEKQLITDAANNMQAFGELYDFYFPRIYSYCLNRLAHKEAAEDVTAQVFLKAIKFVKKFDFKKSNRLGPLLYAVAHNEIVDLIRENSRLLSFDFNEDTKDAPVAMLSANTSGSNGADDFDRALELSIIQKQIASVLLNINERYAEVITLKYYSELETREIAEAMAIKPSQVPVLLFRSLEAFQTEFKKKFPKSEIFYSI